MGGVQGRSRFRAEVDLPGRHRELSLFDRFWKRAARGRAGSMLVTGEPGVGKSALLRAFADRCDGRVSLVSGSRGLLAPNFHGLLQLLRPLAHHAGGSGGLSALVPGSVGKAKDVAMDVLVAVSSHEPVTLLVDDLEGLDDESRRVILGIVSEVVAEKVLVVATSRSPVAGWSGRCVELRSLPDELIEGLLLDRGVTTPVARRLAPVLHGNPLALDSVGMLLSSDQRSGSAVLPRPLPIGQVLTDAYSEVLDTFPAECRAAVLEMAVIEEPLQLDLVVAGADLGPAVATGLVVETASGFALRHPLVREAVLAAATPMELREAHGVVAETLAAAGEGDQSLIHRARSIPESSPEVAEMLVELAGRMSATGDLRASVELLTMAGDLAVDSDSKATSWTRAAVGSYLAGEDRQAIDLTETVRSLQGHGLPVGRLDVIQGLSGLHVLGCDRACDQLEAAAARVEREDPTSAVALLVIGVAYCLYAGRGDRLKVVSRETARVAASQPGTLSGVSALVTVASRLLVDVDSSALDAWGPLLGRLTASLDEVGAGSSLPDGGWDPHRAAFFAALMLISDEDWPPALELLDKVVDHDLASRWSRLLDISAAWRAELLWRSGEWVEALASARRAHSEVSLGSADQPVWLDATLSKIENLMGNDERARSHADAVFSPAVGRLGLKLAESQVWAGMGTALLGRNDPEGAVRVLRHAAEIGGKGELHPGLVWWRGDLVEALVKVGARTEAQYEAEAFHALATRANRPVVLGQSLRARAVASGGDRALRMLDLAVQTHSRSGCPFEMARSELALAEATRSVDSARSQSVAASAHRAFLRLGAVDFARQAVDLSNPPVRTNHRSLAVLSDRELAVAQLIAEGVTNRQIAHRLHVSVKTVEYHLTRVYRRLGVDSRVEVAAFVNRHRPQEDSEN